MRIVVSHYFRQVSKISGTHVTTPFMKARSVALEVVVPILAILYCWQQSHFQFEEYWAETAKQGIRLCMMGALGVMFLSGLKHRVQGVAMAYALTFAMVSIFYSIFNNIIFGEGLLPSIKGLMVLVAMFPLLSNGKKLEQFLRVNFYLGFLLVALNTVVLLHFFHVMQLPFERIPRVGGGLGRPDLDPVSFNLFGRTEAFPAGRTGVPRLQGWSSEPLHWAFFVYWTLTCWVLTFPVKGVGKKYYVAALCVIALHLYFMQSATAFIVGFVILGVAALFFLLRNRLSEKGLSWAIYFILILVPGILTPILIASLDSITHLIYNETVFAKAANWTNKLDFSGIGLGIFTRFAPLSDNEYSASHDLVLGTYLKMGWLMLLPLLALLYMEIRCAVRTTSRRVFVASIIVVVELTLGMEGIFFSPGGMMMQVAILAACLNRVIQRPEGQSEF